MITALLGSVYTIFALTLTDQIFFRIFLAVPFVFVWLMPMLYWFGERETLKWYDRLIHVAAYLSMGWLSFALYLLIIFEALYSLSWLMGFKGSSEKILEIGRPLVFVGSLVMLFLGFWLAR